MLPALEDIAHIATQLEGPYKLYVMGGGLLVLCIIFARFVFKTVKWLLLLLALLALGFVIFYFWQGKQGF